MHEVTMHVCAIAVDPGVKPVDIDTTAVQVVRCRDVYQLLYCCRSNKIAVLVAANTITRQG